MSDYAFDNRWQGTQHRMAALEDWLDPGTARHLTDRGVAAGWHCLEIGAGGGSIARWLGEQVGPDGYVLATDIDPRFLGELERPNLEVRCHNIVQDPLPEAAFDLIHTRLVLAHLSGQALESALNRSVAALKPGGWLVAEEMDFISIIPAPWCETGAAERFARAVDAHNQVMAARGFDCFYGRQVARDLETHGLEDVATEGRAFVWSGGSPGTRAWSVTLEQLFDEIIATAMISADELNQVIECLSDPNLAFLSQLTVAAWGRRP